MPRRYVVEASVAVRWFLPDQDLGSHAERFLALLLAGDIEVLAPANLIHEFCGVICAQFRSRRKSADDAAEVVRKFLKLPISYVQSNDLIERATRLSMIQDLLRHVLLLSWRESGSACVHRGREVRQWYRESVSTVCLAEGSLLSGGLAVQFRIPLTHLWPHEATATSTSTAGHDVSWPYEGTATQVVNGTNAITGSSARGT